VERLDDGTRVYFLMPREPYGARAEGARLGLSGRGAGDVAETGLPGATFPATCPWTVQEVMDGGFWPG